MLKDRSELSIIPDPLIPPVKQNELYQQWRQEVVDKRQYWNEIFAKLSDDELKFRKQYNKAKKERKKRKAKENNKGDRTAKKTTTAPAAAVPAAASRDPTTAKDPSSTVASNNLTDL